MSRAREPIRSVVESIYPVVSCPNVDAARDFYAPLLDLEVVFECGWYTLLRSPVSPAVQLAFVVAGHETVPAELDPQAAGVLISVEVPDVDAVHARAVAMGAEIVWTLRDERFGQRHFMVRDPTGLVLDVISPIPVSIAFRREVARWRRTRT
jgi:catechol 2,3-dioxygenase-like lactoylglutathione lyase family enzyme